MGWKIGRPRKGNREVHPLNKISTFEGDVHYRTNGFNSLQRRMEKSKEIMQETSYCINNHYPKSACVWKGRTKAESIYVCILLEGHPDLIGMGKNGTSPCRFLSGSKIGFENKTAYICEAHRTFKKYIKNKGV